MAARTALFLLPAAFLLTPYAAVAQTPSPAASPEVEAALRGRVTEFFQDFVDKKFRQALNLVAEDTQDEYFSSTKAEIKTFKIDGISFSPDFTKAEVHLTVRQIWKLRAEGFMKDEEVDAPMNTTWKTEEGKWVFYHQVQTEGWLTPMGPSANVRTDPAKTIPKKLDDATITSEANRLLHQTSVDKDRVTLAADKPSSAKVVFHNGAQGAVSVSVAGAPSALAGFTAKLDKQQVNAGQDAVLEISYTPPAGQTGPPPGFTIAVDVDPFSQFYPVEIEFGTQAK